MAERKLRQGDRVRVTVEGDALIALTPRERSVTKEAAVMGYFRGTLAARGEAIPPDTAILREVIACCLDHPDLYPAITAAARARADRAAASQAALAAGRAKRTTAAAARRAEYNRLRSVGYTRAQAARRLHVTDRTSYRYEELREPG